MIPFFNVRFSPEGVVFFGRGRFLDMKELGALFQ